MEQVIIRAVAGVLKNGNHVLISSRPSNKIYAGSWEFPGGKLEKGETKLAALVRELNEEIGIAVLECDCEPLTHIVQNYPHGQVQLDVIMVKKWHGIPTSLEGQGMYWQDLSQVCNLEPLLITTQQILNLLFNKFKE